MAIRYLGQLSTVLVVGIVSALTGSLSGQAPPPNVVLIISDDQGWTDYGFMGHSHIQTPCLDRLARESLTFTRGYVPTSLCRPSLASIITGLYPHQHKLAGNDPSPVADREAGAAAANAARRAELIEHIDRVATLPRLLAAKGYVSFQSGKWWEGNYARGGFTEGMTRGFPEPGGRHGDDGLNIGRKGLAPVFDFIRRAQRDQSPFFLWYAPFLPHAPHTPPARLLSKYQPLTDSLPIAKYWAMCEWFDETCGQLLTFLDENQLRDNTLVVYVTDNGWINLPNASAFAPRSKRSPYDGGVRTPIMLRLPGRFAPERDEIHLASSIDLAPTILRACGLAPTAEMSGIDLLNRSLREQREQIFGEIFDHDQSDLQHPAASLRYRWTVRGDWKLIEPFSRRLPNEATQLFQIRIDPFEQDNRAAQQTELVQSMRAGLDAWWTPDP
jgi:uncharacterized sulfatase